MYFLYSHWLDLSLDTRLKLASAFGIVRSGSAHVFDNKIVDDGFTVKQIEGALTVPAMQKFINNKITEPQALWSAVINKIEHGEVTKEVKKRTRSK